MLARRFLVFLIALVFCAVPLTATHSGEAPPEAPAESVFASGPAAGNRCLDVHCGLQSRPGGSEIDASGRS